MIQLKIKEETLSRVEKILAGVPKGAGRAMANAMNRGLAKIRTGAKMEAQQVYTVKAGAFSEAANVRIKKASTGELAGYVSFNGHKIPLYKFHVTPKSPGTKRPVYASVKKGSGGTSSHGFIAEMQGGHTGVFTRKGKGRFPVSERMGLATAQMVGNEEVLARLEEEAQEMVDKRVEHEISRILNGYGG